MDLATISLDRIRQAIAAYGDARSPAALKRGVQNALVATPVFAGAIVAAVWVWRRAHHLLRHRLQPRILAMGLQPFTVIGAERIAGALQSGLGVLRGMVLLVITLVYLGFVFAQFPWTRDCRRTWSASHSDLCR